MNKTKSKVALNKLCALVYDLEGEDIQLAVDAIMGGAHLSEIEKKYIVDNGGLSCPKCLSPLVPQTFCEDGAMARRVVSCLHRGHTFEECWTVTGLRKLKRC